jgi:hypothetical protein
MTSQAPDRSEAADYYFRYIDLVPDGDVRDLLERQAGEMLDLLGSISDDRSLFRYAADKWSMRQVVSHVIDTERVFVFRAFWFARGFDSPLPSFDQDRAVAAAAPDDRRWRDLIADFRATRADSIRFFRALALDAWARRGVASDKPFTVRALAYLSVGHATHHLQILRDRYL